jgi:hypothetical protein
VGDALYAAGWNAERWLTTGDGTADASGEAADGVAAGAAGVRINALVAAALTRPLQGLARPAPTPYAYVRALAGQRDRQLAVEQLLREGDVLERIAAEVCAAADELIEDEAQ